MEPARHITDIDITGKVALKSGSVLGAAHEHLVTGILMRLGFDVSVSSMTTAHYDLLIGALTDGRGSDEQLIKAQVKTCKGNSLDLTGGSRGGKDRITIPGVKDYKYTPEHCDLMVGVDKESLDIYLFPVRFAERYGKSVSVRKIAIVRNNWDILLHWNNVYLQRLEGQLK